MAPKYPTKSQQRAIECADDAMLVIAGPGSGKTYCLIERIRFLIEKKGVSPDRICAFTFTNKAAGEIAHRLAEIPDGAARGVTRGTIHSFCVRLLRERPEVMGLPAGFGIADDDYQTGVLKRLRVNPVYAGKTLGRFSAYKNCGTPFEHSGDEKAFRQYNAYLQARKVLDFDDIVIKAGELLQTEWGDEIRARWDVLLVDEFQDLNPRQYDLIKQVCRDHRTVFAVGDDEQSIYGWAGARPQVFSDFMNEFELTHSIQLEENHRCPETIFGFARKLISQNSPVLAERTPQLGTSEEGQIEGRVFTTEEEEFAWILADIGRNLNQNIWRAGEIALLYRNHDFGDRLEPCLINAGIPSRLARARALGEHPAIRYVVAALRLIRDPSDEVLESNYFETVLRGPLLDRARVHGRSKGVVSAAILEAYGATLPKKDSSAIAIRRSLVDYRNLRAVAKQSLSAGDLVNALLAKRVGLRKTILEEREPELSDPAESNEVTSLAAILGRVYSSGEKIWLEEENGAGCAVAGMLRSIGITNYELAKGIPEDVPALLQANCATLGLPLTVFKAAQFLEMQSVSPSALTFTAIDTETSTFDAGAEIIDFGAVRVRDGVIVEEFGALVKPERPISAEATDRHNITNEMVTDAPSLREVWPEFRRFCGSDVIVAHNGYDFDFPLIDRHAESIGDAFDVCRFDTLPLARDLFPTSPALKALAAKFEIPYGNHRALPDATSLAHVYLKLEEESSRRGRKTACLDLLEHLGIALALCDPESLCDEAKMFLEFCPVYVLGRYSHSLESYGRWSENRQGVASVDQIIDRFGGKQRMERIRAEKTAADRYPAALARLKVLLNALESNLLDQQIVELLDKIALSMKEKGETSSDRVSLLTLHATKGLEFPVVYIVGVETSVFPGTREQSQELSVMEESRRLLYVGMTRAQTRLVMTCVETRNDEDCCGHQFLDEMGIAPKTGN